MSIVKSMTMKGPVAPKLESLKEQRMVRKSNTEVLIIDVTILIQSFMLWRVETSSSILSMAATETLTISSVLIWSKPVSMPQLFNRRLPLWSSVWPSSLSETPPIYYIFRFFKY